MFKITKNKKGFTLVELAIVLVVIGLLMGMAFKGKSLVDAARIKADIQKINKIATAVNVYNSKYDTLPGMRAVAGSSIMKISPKDFYDDLITEGLLQDGDFKMKIFGGAYFAASGCEDAKEGNNSVWKAVEASEQNNLCLSSIGGTTPTSPDFRAFTAASFAANVGLNYIQIVSICQIESLLDDKNIFAGDGRVAEIRRDEDGAIAKLSASDGFDCAKYAQGATALQNGATYMIRIF